MKTVYQYENNVVLVENSVVFINLVHIVHTLGRGLSNLQKFDNLATCVNLLPTFATLIPNAGPHFLQKGPEEGVIYLQISEMYIFYYIELYE